MVERQTGVALWRQIADRMRLAINNGDFDETGMMPPETVLAGRFGVNRHTVRSAMAALAEEGIVRPIQGIGTRMRLAILHLLFDGLEGERATTSAFADNGPSNGVTRRLGYEPNGESLVAREGASVRSLRYVMHRAAWEARGPEQRPDVELHGVPALRTFLGLAATEGSSR